MVLGLFLWVLLAGTVEAVGLGIGIRPIYADDKNRLNLPDTAGCIVVVVQKGGLGDLIGLKIGDVIRTFNGEPVLNMTEFMKQAQQAPTLQTVGIWRDGNAQTISGQGAVAGSAAGSTSSALPERSQPLEGFQGITWNMPLAQARQQLQTRSGLTNGSAGGSEKEIYTLQYKGTFGGRAADLSFEFAGGQFYKGTAALRSPVDDVLNNYEALLADISGKYGPANQRRGKYLDQKTVWLFPVGQDPPDGIVMDIERLSNASASVFVIRIQYIYGTVQKALNDKKKTSTNKDL